MINEVEDFKKFGKFLGQCIGKSMYYGIIIAYLIMQIGCGKRIPTTEESVKKADRSVQYGTSHHKLVANHTSALFY